MSDDNLDETPWLRDAFEAAFAADMRGMSVDNWPNLVAAAREVPEQAPYWPTYRLWQRLLAVDALFDFVARMAALPRSTRDPRVV